MHSSGVLLPQRTRKCADHVFRNLLQCSKRGKNSTSRAFDSFTRGEGGLIRPPSPRVKLKDNSHVHSRIGRWWQRFISQPKWWVLVGDQDERVGDNPVMPTHDTLHEVEHPLRIVLGEQNGEPGDDYHHNGRDVQKEQHYVV